MAETKYEQRLNSTGRNDTCPCGSGKKYKKCHLQEDEGKRSKDMAKAAEEAAARAAEEEAKEESTEEKKDDHGHPPEHKGRKGASTKPKPKPATVARQVSTPRKAGTS